MACLSSFLAGHQKNSLFCGKLLEDFAIAAEGTPTIAGRNIHLRRKTAPADVALGLVL
jgi:hypothetical protein